LFSAKLTNFEVYNQSCLQGYNKIFVFCILYLVIFETFYFKKLKFNKFEFLFI